MRVRWWYIININNTSVQDRSMVLSTVCERMSPGWVKRNKFSPTDVMRSWKTINFVVKASGFYNRRLKSSYWASIFRIISSVNSEHFDFPPRSPVMKFPSLITWKLDYDVKSSLVCTFAIKRPVWPHTRHLYCCIISVIKHKSVDKINVFKNW